MNRMRSVCATTWGLFLWTVPTASCLFDSLQKLGRKSKNENKSCMQWLKCSHHLSKDFLHLFDLQTHSRTKRSLTDPITIPEFSFIRGIIHEENQNEGAFNIFHRNAYLAQMSRLTSPLKIWKWMWIRFFEFWDKLSNSNVF